MKDFAQLMVSDHSGVNEAGTGLARKLGLKPEDNPMARSLKQGGDANLAKLKALDGAAFERAYVEHEVAYHQAVIDTLDKTLIPSARNGELKALMVKVRPAVMKHLEHAKHLQALLPKTP